jgi:hypothetical protein
VGTKRGPAGCDGREESSAGNGAVPVNGEGVGRVPRWVVSAPAGSLGGYLAGADPAIESCYPALHDFLCVTNVRGKDRRTGSLSLFVEDGRVKAALNDREEGMVAFVSGKSVLELAGSLEKGLQTGTLDWRPSRRR